MTTLNRWKIILAPTITDAQFNSHLAAVCHTQQTGIVDRLTAPIPPETEPAPSISEVLSPDPAIVRYVFHIGEVRAYSGTFDRAILDVVRLLPFVQDVQPVHVVFKRAMVGHVQITLFLHVLLQLTFVSTASRDQSQMLGLGAISHRSGSGNDCVYDANQTHEVVVYIIDTGIRITHSEFGGRASHGARFPPGEPDKDTDNDGHGTHVAGTVGGRTCGVAKTAKIIAVKVYDENTPSEDDDLSAGIQWAINHATGPAGHGLRTGMTSTRFTISWTITDQLKLSILAWAAKPTTSSTISLTPPSDGA